MSTRLARLRPALVRVHRWAGLVLVGFLVIAGLSGSLLSWNQHLEAAISPQLFRAVPDIAGALPLDPLVLRERLAVLYPGASTGYVPLRVEPGRSIWFFMEPLIDPLTGRAELLPNDQVFLNPYTGDVLGERRWGDISQGLKNLMPFIYRLHYSLALGETGTWIFGIVALLWTLDCFVGAWLTFPVRGRTPYASGPPGSHRSWRQRWLPAWKIRWRSGRHKVNFDLHRAGGLWAWAMLFVLAWSGVAFNLNQVYQPVMRAFLEFESPAGPPVLDTPQARPGIPWMQARQRARSLMAEQAKVWNFTIWEEIGLGYDSSRAMYRYSVNSSRDVRDAGGDTSLLFNANTGELELLSLPTGKASGDTVTRWLKSLHMAAVGGIPFKVFLSAIGVLVAMLGVTGAVIWQRKRQARQ